MAEPNDLRIATVEVSHLFGIPGSLEVSLLPQRSDQPVSAIILGENGSGKSSISKAIEFAVQGRLNRSSIKIRMPKSRLLNIAQDSNQGSAQVTLSDGTKILRTASWDIDDQSFSIEGPEPPKYLRRAPIVLTRADILEFIDSAPSARGKIFLGYQLLDPGQASEIGEPPSVQYLEEKIQDCKRQIRETAIPIAEHLDRPRPYETPKIIELISELYHGLPRSQRNRVQIPKRLESKIALIEELHRQIGATENELKRVKRLTSAGASRKVAELKATLGDVAQWLTEAFHEITHARHIQSIRVELGESNVSALDVRITTADGQTFGERIFSEGYQDLVVMLFFLATARVAARYGQFRVLVLDDVLQSVDANIRVALMKFILKEFKDWQLIVTVHDRLWREQLHRLMLDAAVQHVSIELRNWSFASGSAITQSSRDPGAALRTVIPTGEPSAISALAGRLLEQTCDVLSWTIPVRVQRRPNDFYTLEDLWPGVFSALRHSSVGTSIEQVEGFRHLRNLVGAHHNEWAQTVTLSETERFAAAVLDLLRHTWCDGCTSWVQQVGRGTLRCSCGEIELTGIRAKN